MFDYVRLLQKPEQPSPVEAQASKLGKIQKSTGGTPMKKPSPKKSPKN